MECINLAEKIFGWDVSVLKGKSTRPHPPVVGKEDIIEIPPELNIADTEVAADVMFVEDQAFVNAVDQKVKFKSLAWLGTFKKLNDEQLMAGLDKIIHHFKRQGIKITYLHLDGKFKSLKRQGEKRWELKINLSAPDEHVPDAERNNRTLQDRVRVLYY